MTIESSISFFIAIFIFGITPGPGTFAVLATALSRGAKSCIMLALGMTISDILYLIAASLGLALIATQWSEVFIIVCIIGASYLIYLGYQIWNSPIAENTNKETNKKTLGLFIQGLLISFSNPKVIIFYIAFLPTFFDVSKLDVNGIIIVSTLALVALMLGLLSIAFFAEKAKILLKNKSSLEKLNKIIAMIMISAGIYLAFIR